MSETCNRKLLSGYLADQLDLEERLDFLFHLDSCPRCWEEVYSATKARHPHYYKNSSRQLKMSERELKRLERTEEVFEVA